MTTLPVYLQDAAMAFMATLALSWMLISTLQRLRTFAWVTLKHPGNSPNLTLLTTTVRCEQVTRQYDSDPVALELYSKIYNASKQQLLLSVNSSFVCAPEDPTFGFMAAMMQYLDSIYSTFTPEELEANRLELSKPWNPDSPVEEL
jgi:hypothetical protein